MKLFLCEKPSQGRDIAAVLGATKKMPGHQTGNGVCVTWGFGHLLKQADTVVIATDADREGEVIAREILDYCHYQGKIERLWLSALDEASVRAALAAIKPGSATLPYYLAGLGRARADWQIGMNMTRLYSVKARENGYGSVLSVGRVQTPTLNLVVVRDRDIAQFVPKPYWNVVAQLAAGGIVFQAQWVPAAAYCDEEKRCINPTAAQQVVQLCQKTGQATVAEVETKRETESAPLAFDLGTLQQTCSRRFGYGAQQVLDIAQSLYETHKATTYPRTDCGYLPTSMRGEIGQVMASIQQSDPSLSAIISRLDVQHVSRIWNDKKITAHHGIIPTKQPCDLAKMSEQERNVYQLIRLHYLFQFLPNHEVDATRVSLHCGGQLFKASGKVVVVAGWKSLFGKDAEEDTDVAGDKARLPAMAKGSVCQVTGAEAKAQQTKPPEHYTEGTLIAAMKNAAQFVTDSRLKKILKDNAGLGTEATRAGVIETLLKRGFVVKKGKHLLATPIAGDLMDVLPAQLKDPGMTALWEQSLDDIAEGRMSLDDFMAKQSAWTMQLVAKGQQQTVKITLPPSPPCPICGGATRQHTGKSGAFWGCINYPDCNGIVNVGAKKPARRRKSPAKKSG